MLYHVEERFLQLKEASEIAGKANCSAKDVERFVTCLDCLVKECGYILDESSEYCNWILR